MSIFKFKFLQLQVSVSGVTTWPFVEKEGPFSYEGLPNFAQGNFKQIPLIIGFNSEELIFICK